MRASLHRILHGIGHQHIGKSTQAERNLRRTGSHTPSIHRATPDSGRIEPARDAGSLGLSLLARPALSRRNSAVRRDGTVRLAARSPSRRLSVSTSGEMTIRPVAPRRLGASSARPASAGRSPGDHESPGHRPPAPRARPLVAPAPSSAHTTRARAGNRGPLSWLLMRDNTGWDAVPTWATGVHLFLRRVATTLSRPLRVRATERWFQREMRMVDAGYASRGTLALDLDLAQHFLWRRAVLLRASRRLAAPRRGHRRWISLSWRHRRSCSIARASTATSSAWHAAADPAQPRLRDRRAARAVPCRGRGTAIEAVRERSGGW
ncbi:uncharacterized protein SOCE836_066830 [Sorangium cellulosum]|uniref:Uncharacterized protein n=1 Tax=Sorangium cellulosum TaxID=56 RepID=A0A4P2QVQ0_SORCE|nr:uncharacterized protein SOCE836_066830 [Sorangium cellulosum]WCQ93823.1 hypothetical protein NQZ70_06579 [Sorangium sp. Soce836]